MPHARARHLARLCKLVCWVLVAGCGYRSPYAVQKDYAQSFAPAALDTNAAAVTQKRLTVRVWVDGAYKKSTLRWRERVEAQLQRASDVLAHRFGVGLTLVEIRDWDGAGDELPASLALLQRQDPGDDVDWVWGVVKALPMVTAVHEHLGFASVLGRHLVTRAMDDVKEAQAFGDVFTLLSDNELAELYRERREHKETTVLLHELGHTLGALHSRDPECLMLSNYDHRATGFGRDNRAIVELGLAFKTDKGRSGWATELARALRRPDNLWESEDLHHLEKFLAGDVSANKAVPLSEAHRRRYDEAVAALSAGDVGRADLVVMGLLELYPTNADVLTLACHIAVTLTPPASDALARCDAAQKVLPTDINVALAKTFVHLRRNEPELARASLSAAWPLLVSATDANWRWVGTLSQEMLSPTWVREAAEHAGSKKAELLDWSTDVERHLCLPRDGSVARDVESDYLAAVRDIQRARQQRSSKETQARIEWLRRTFSKASGRLAIDCELTAPKDASKALRLCLEALQVQEDCVPARMLAGNLAVFLRQDSLATEHFKRVIELTPDYHEAWKRLAELYQRRNDTQARRTLAEAYKARFGASL